MVNLKCTFQANYHTSPRSNAWFRQNWICSFLRFFPFSSISTKWNELKCKICWYISPADVSFTDNKSCSVVLTARFILKCYTEQCCMKCTFSMKYALSIMQHCSDIIKLFNSSVEVMFFIPSHSYFRRYYRIVSYSLAKIPLFAQWKHKRETLSMCLREFCGQKLTNTCTLQIAKMSELWTSC